MKKTLLVLLCFVLLLSACGKTPELESTAAPDAETTAASEPVSTGEPAPISTGETAPASSPATDPTSATEAATAATEAPAPPEQPLFSGSVTAGGFRVHTDDSSYTPYTAPKPLYTRLREGPLEEFEPSADYGSVYPYIAARVFLSADNDGWENGARYGFVDRGGRILTDGIYISVKALGDLDMEHDEQRYLPFWITTQVLGVTYHEEEENPDLSWLEDDTRMGLVSMDGSFVLPCVYRSIQPMGDGFICYRNWNEPDFEVYGPDCRLRFTGRDLYEGAELDGWDVRCSEGLYLVVWNYNDAPDVCWFCDAEGNHLLGPYQAARPFHDGLACVSLDNEHYGYIDREGNWVIPDLYRNLADFHDGLAIQELEVGSQTVLDPTGKQIVTLGSAWLNWAECGFRAEDKDSNLVSYYDREGRLLCRGGENLQCLDERTFVEQQENGVRLFRIDGSEILAEGMDYVYRGSGLLNGEPALGYRGRNYSTDEECFIPADLSAVLRDQPDAPTDSFYSASYDSQDEFTNELWHITWDGRIWDLRRGDAPEIQIPLRASWMRVRGERIFVMTDWACAYYDLQGKLVFYYPLNAED